MWKTTLGYNNCEQKLLVYNHKLLYLLFLTVSGKTIIGGIWGALHSIKVAISFKLSFDAIGNSPNSFDLGFIDLFSF